MITLRCRPQGATPSEILLERGIAATLRRRTAGRRVFALVDDAIASRFGDLLDAGWNVMRLAGGEAIKTLATAERVLLELAAAGIDRSGLLLAIGGGTIGDLGGFCAALWLRGIECWQVPTTLMGMVDSAVGGKTAVNLPAGKNLVGAVHAPALVLVDPLFLRELPQREFDSGLAEALKVAIGLDAELFALLEQHGDAVRGRADAPLLEVIRRSLAAKAAIVELDLREDGRRRLLNLGHTLGHALEAWSDHARPHGHCVARGLWFALDLAASLRAIDAAAADRCRRLLAAFGHAPDPLPPAAELEPFLRRDKKAAGARVHFVLPTGIGRSEVRAVEFDVLVRLLGS